MPNLETDVLIVGAGPVGLFLANECARRNVRWRLIETKTSQSEHSKALAIFPRTMEIFDMAGLVDPFLKAANRVTKVSVVTKERKLAEMRFAPGDTPYSFVAMVPQNVTEQLLADQLKHRGGTVQYGTTFQSAIQHGNYVTATLDRNGKPQQISAAFVVGCDGAHSTLRHQLDIPFEGAEYRDLFLLADVETDPLPADELKLCPDESGPLAFFPITTTRRRIIATIPKEEDDPPPLALVQRIIDERGPIKIKAKVLHWSSYFRIHHRQVAKMRVGRMFIGGDAAHIHSPVGGQGMNIGLHDMWNLAWKLDLFLRGHGNEALLDSYGAERLPVIRHVITTTHVMTKAFGTPSKWAQKVRDAIIPMLSHLAPFQHAFVQQLSELGIAYYDSPIIEGAGERYFDDSLRGGRGIASRFLLITREPEAAKHLGDTFHEILEVRAGHNGGLTLVRPDGYVAYSTHRSGPAALKTVQALLERQTETVAP